MFKNDPTDSKVITELKKSIIKTLLESDTSQDIFNEDIMSRIKNNDVKQSNTTSSQPDVVVEEMAM